MSTPRSALLAAVFAAACFACSSGTPAPSPPSDPAARRAFDAAADALARDRSIPRDSVALVSQSETTWPNACLGCAKEGEMCAQVMTPGYRIVLSAAGATHEYHTDANGVARPCGR